MTARPSAFPRGYPAAAPTVRLAPPAHADLDLLVDIAYGVLWYRLLIGHAPLDERAARDVAAHLVAAGRGAGE